jgi:hypothetical protein
MWHCYNKQENINDYNSSQVIPNVIKRVQYSLVLHLSISLIIVPCKSRQFGKIIVS